jgi:hypothetical protein
MNVTKPGQKEDNSRKFKKNIKIGQLVLEITCIKQCINIWTLVKVSYTSVLKVALIVVYLVVQNC